MTMRGEAQANQDEERLVLGIDIGTTRLKVAAYDADLQPVHDRVCEIGALPGSGKGQLDPVNLWHALRSQLTDLLQFVEAPRVKAIGIAGMAESGCLIDAEAIPLTPLLLWHDRRGIRQATALRRKAEEEFATRTGLKTTSVRSIAKWMWMIDHGASRRARWCGVPEWIALCLTGNWLTDATLAVRSGVFDVLKGEYSPELLDIAGARPGLFPPVQPTPARAGTLLPAVANELGLADTVQVVIAGHDDIAAAYGAGGKPGDLVDSAGTAEGLIRIVDAPPLPLRTVGSRMAMTRFYEPGTWALLAGAGSTGALMQLTADMLQSDPAKLDAMATAPDQYGAGIIDVRLSKNVLPTIKISEGAAAPEVWSAVLDLVCDRVQGAALRLEGLAGRASRLVLIGGAARSQELVRRKAARLGLPAVALAGVEATTRGAAALAALAFDPELGGSTRQAP
jgi:sugar (pentulose or hexulose) kinase